MQLPTFGPLCIIIIIIIIAVMCSTSDMVHSVISFMVLVYRRCSLWTFSVTSVWKYGNTRKKADTDSKVCQRVTTDNKPNPNIDNVKQQYIISHL